MDGDPGVSPRVWRQWIHSPLLFTRECLGVKPDDWQVEALRAEEGVGVRRLGMRACKNPGKTAVLSWLGLWFYATRMHPKVICTSMSGPNLMDGLWSEFSRWCQDNPIFKRVARVGKTTIINPKFPETWWIAARQWNRSAEPGEQARTLAGKHADNLMFIVDEAGGLPRPVVWAAEAALGSGVDTRLVIAGNPWDLESPLYDADVTHAHLWHMIRITGDPDDPRRAPRVSAEWARQMIEAHGRDNPFVMTDVLGKWPPSSINTLLGPDEVQAAMERHVPEASISGAQRRIGVDCARFGDDETCLFPRQGLVAFEPVVLRNADTHEIAARVLVAKANFRSELELVDDTGGYGAGVIDNLNLASAGHIGINFGGKAINPRYYNKRTEMWWEMAQWIKRGGALPEDPKLRRELTAPMYTFHEGKILLEAKDQIKKRLGFSPDRADALALTFALPDAPSAGPSLPEDVVMFNRIAQVMQRESDNVAPDYNPLEDRHGKQA